MDNIKMIQIVVMEIKKLSIFGTTIVIFNDNMASCPPARSK